MPARVPQLFGAAFLGPQQRDQNGPIGVVGVSRISGEVFAFDKFTTTEKVSYFFQLLAGVNLVLFLFNLLPIYPLDGGHVAGALYEKARSTVARLRGRPDPGPFDIARLMPVAYAVAGLFLALSALLFVADIVNPITLAGQPSPAQAIGVDAGTASARAPTPAQGILAVMAIPVSLGMPAAPPPVLAPRRKTRQLDVGGVGVGSDFPVSVQSMTTTSPPTSTPPCSRSRN